MYVLVSRKIHTNGVSKLSIFTVFKNYYLLFKYWLRSKSEIAMNTFVFEELISVNTLDIYI